MKNFWWIAGSVAVALLLFGFIFGAKSQPSSGIANASGVPY